MCVVLIPKTCIIFPSLDISKVSIYYLFLLSNDEFMHTCSFKYI